MTDPKIIHAQPDDVPRVAPLFDTYRVWYGATSDLNAARRFLTQRLTNNDSTVFLATVDETPAGFTQLYPLFSSISMEPILLLNDLFVVEEFRGNGIGSLLLNTAAQFGREVGAIRLELDTEHTNKTAQVVYEKLGWKRDDVFQQYVLNLS